MKVGLLSSVLALATLALSPSARSQSIGEKSTQGCEAYPYQPLDTVIDIDQATGQFKILATGAASVDFDDPTDLMNARREAELIAKRSIAEYINQKLTSQDSVETEVEKTSNLAKAADGSVISEAQRNAVKKQLTAINGKADAVLKGVVPIGSCYTRAHEVRVTVGIKSQTVDNASKLGETMDASADAIYGQTQDAPSQSRPGSTANGAAQEGQNRNYSSSKGLENFSQSGGPKH